MIEDFIVEFYDAAGAQQSLMLYRRLTFCEALSVAALRMAADEEQSVASVVVRKAHAKVVHPSLDDLLPSSADKERFEQISATLKAADKALMEDRERRKTGHE